MVKCHQNVNFEEIGTELSTGKNDKEYLKRKSSKMSVWQC